MNMMIRYILLCVTGFITGLGSLFVLHLVVKMAECHFKIDEDFSIIVKELLRLKAIYNLF